MRIGMRLVVGSASLDCRLPPPDWSSGQRARALPCFAADSCVWTRGSQASRSSFPRSATVSGDVELEDLGRSLEDRRKTEVHGLRGSKRKTLPDVFRVPGGCCSRAETHGVLDPPLSSIPGRCASLGPAAAARSGIFLAGCPSGGGAVQSCRTSRPA